MIAHSGQVKESTVTIEGAARQVLEFIRARVPQPRVACLAGNSVHADKNFLAKEMPEVVEHLHYRIVDVSTVSLENFCSPKI